jgi:hypothetical protein
MVLLHFMYIGFYLLLNDISCHLGFQTHPGTTDHALTFIAPDGHLELLET